MEVDDYSSSTGDDAAPGIRIIQRLATNGFPEECFEDFPLGVIAFAKKNKACIPELVSAILPTDAEVAEAVHEAEEGSEGATLWPTSSDLYRESMIWLQWLMFEEDPFSARENLANMSVGQSGICGAVWGTDDVAFRCRTCEHDPTCAICVSCFKNGNHKDHDYSIIYTGGGCCDCGDETAWKPEGFCSKHRGTGMIQPLSDDIAQSLGPVCDALFDFWKAKLKIADSASTGNSRENDNTGGKAENELTSKIVEMLLEFCRCSESLLSFISKKLMSVDGLLDLLVRAERFLREHVTKELHGLLLKLLGEPVFKYEFGKAIVNYYPVYAHEVVKARGAIISKKYPLLSTLPVQIFTVPALTARLVKEVNLLEVLLDCVREILLCSSGEDGLLQVNSWSNLFDTTLRILEDVKFVVSHPEVADYITCEQQHLFQAWLGILCFVQGMDPQKREVDIHVEEEDENIELPFYLCHSLFKISSLMVSCAFKVNRAKETFGDFGSCKNTVEDEHGQKPAKLGRISQESSSSISTVGGNSNLDDSSCLLMPSYISLTFECLRVIDGWFVKNSNISNGWSRFRSRNSNLMVDADNMTQDTDVGSESFQVLSSPAWHNVNHDVRSQEITMTQDIDDGSESFQVLSLPAWHNVNYDVSSREITMHIPFHQLLSFMLKEALRKHCGDSVLHSISGLEDPSASDKLDFFGRILRGCQPCGFSSFMMEHPLQIRVFCAQVRAGMWRKNGDAAIISYNMYRSSQWSSNALELDLFLLQICAAFAPADDYARRILVRFGLLSYVSLDLQPRSDSEFEPFLVQEMLALIIQIVKERRYCGHTVFENLQRELVCKLATGDATRSQIQESLPHDLSKVDLQEVLDNISQYSNPSGMKQGRYSLKLSYWKELDLYHPRWNPRDLQIAEEKFLRFCGVSALTSQFPKWTKIYQPLNGISRIATCKTVLEIIRAVVFYSVCDKTAQARAPDGVLIAALHLLSLALDICSVHRECGGLFQEGEFIPLLSFAGEEIIAQQITTTEKHSLLSLLVSLLKSQKSMSHSVVEVGSLQLHSLVESLLKKFAELHSGCKNKLQQVAPDVHIHLFQPLEGHVANIFGSTSDANDHKEKARKRQAAVLAKMKAEQSKFLESVKSEESDQPRSGEDEQLHHAGEDSVDSTHQICALCHDPASESSLSLLVHLQKSRIASLADRGPPSWDMDLHPDKGEACATTSAMTTGPFGGDAAESTKCVLPISELMQLVRDAVNEFASSACPAEVDDFVDYLEKRKPELLFALVRPIDTVCRDKVARSLESVEQELFSSIQKKISSAAFDSIGMDDDSVIFAEGLKETTCTDSILVGKYVASLTRLHSESSSGSNSNDLHAEPAMPVPPYDGFGPIGGDGIHISSCGHVVHQGCLDRYLSSLKESGVRPVSQGSLNDAFVPSDLVCSFKRSLLFEGGHIVDPDQGEFLCPVCRRLANSVLPADCGDPLKFLGMPTSVDTNSSSFRPVSVAPSQQATLSLKRALCLLKSAACAVSREEILKSFSTPSTAMASSVGSVFKMLCGMYSPENKDAFSRAHRVRPSVLIWDTLKYSVVSTEIAARSVSDTASSSTDSSLNTELNFSGGIILPILLRLAQSTRTESPPDVFLRFRGILLFAASIFCGYNECSSSLTRHDGKIPQVLKLIDGDHVFPDIQFWTRASDPVLSRDPFCTLMWIIFCLPRPFMSHKESLISLLHMFYTVNITQAIIAYCVNYEGKVDFAFPDCLVTDIAKLLLGSDTACQCFVSNRIDPSSNLKDGIRLLSLPFLRRCALFFKLLNSSTSVQQFGGLCSSGTSDVYGMVSGVFRGDLNEVGELESMFGIPSVDVILEDKLLRSLVPKWISHFHENLKNRDIQHQLYLNPAAPFQLMRLPSVYQELIQRYIKSRCLGCNSVLIEPALCLLCGRLCSWKSCCRLSERQSHATSCGAGTGVFLLIKETTVLLQRNDRRARWPSPYLDAFGEEDPEMRRGKPLYLNEERYSALNFMVASHGLDRCSKVLRQTTRGFFLI